MLCENFKVWQTVTDGLSVLIASRAHMLAMRLESTL